MTKNLSPAVKAGVKSAASNAAWLPPLNRPPHDPLRIPLDGRIGWRINPALSEHLDISPLDNALTIAADPASGRQLNEPSGSFGGLVPPPNVALMPDGGVFLLDWQTAKLKRFDPCECVFETVPCTGGFGADPRQLGEWLQPDDASFPGIGICGGNLFVCDPGNHRLQVFSLHGFALRGFWNPPEDQTDQPWQPMDVAFDAHGYVLVADLANGCVHRFNPGGRWIDCIDGAGAVRALATDCQNRLYLFLGEHSNVQLYGLQPLQSLGTAESHPAVAGAFGQALLPVTPDGCLNLSGLCWQDNGPALFDPHGQPVSGKLLTPAHTFAQQALYISTPLDSHLYQCQWDRISIQGVIPDGARLKVSTYTAETALSDGQIQNLSADVWSPVQTVFPGDLQPHHPQGNETDWDCLIRSEPGRYLWLRLEWVSDGNVTPRIERILVDFPRITLRRYLPAVLGAEPVSADLTDRFLAIFDRGFRGLESQLDQQARLFDPLSAPADSGGKRRDFLSWLASWIGVTLDRQLPLIRQRQILKQAGKLFPLRGTFCGLRKTLQLYLGHDQAYCPSQPDCAPCTHPEPPAWQPPQLILEHFQLRRWLFLGAGRLGDQSRLWGQSIVNRSQLSGPQTNGNAQLGVSQLNTTQDPFRDPMNVYAHKFSVFVPGCIARSPRRRKSLERLIELEKPAHTAHQLIFVEPRFRIGVQSMIGFDAVIGCYPQGVVLDQAGLGKATVLGPAIKGGPEQRIGQNSTIGTSTLIN